MANEQPDFGGWGPRAWDLLKQSVDDLRRDVDLLLGNTPPQARDRSGEPRVAGLGIGTWVTFLSLCLVPIIVALLTTDTL